MLVQLRALRGTTPDPILANERAPILAHAAMVRAARIADMAQIAPLINGYAARGLLLPKTQDQLYRTFREFVVAIDHDDRVIGCAGLRTYGPRLAELCALAVDERAHGRGVGRMLVEATIEQAAELEIRTVFALTLEATFFQRLGFRVVRKELFPQKIATDCAGCAKRNACPEITVARMIGPHLDEEEFADA